MKLFVLEDGSQNLIQLVERTEDREKVISALAPIEVRSAIRRRERLGDISDAHADQALSALLAESRRLVEQPLSSDVLSRAAALLDRHALRSLDALQLATSLVLREQLLHNEELLFICSDNRLIEAAAAENLKTYNPAVD